MTNKVVKFDPAYSEYKKTLKPLHGEDFQSLGDFYACKMEAHGIPYSRTGYAEFCITLGTVKVKTELITQAHLQSAVVRLGIQPFVKTKSRKTHWTSYRMEDLERAWGEMLAKARQQ